MLFRSVEKDIIIEEKRGTYFYDHYLTVYVLMEAMAIVRYMVELFTSSPLLGRYQTKFFAIAAKCGDIEQIIEWSPKETRRWWWFRKKEPALSCELEKDKYRTLAMIKADNSYRLKKNLIGENDIFNLRYKDPELGAAYDSESNLAVGVSGFDNVETESAIAQHVIVEAKSLTRLETLKHL